MSDGEEVMQKGNNNVDELLPSPLAQPISLLLSLGNATAAATDSCILETPVGILNANLSHTRCGRLF